VKDASMTNLKLKLLLPPLLLVISASSLQSSSPVKNNELLIFEGSVLKVGQLPTVSCGVMAVYQLASYRIDRVLVGDYKDAEIVVDHLACKRDVLEGVHSGDKVIVVINKKKRILQRWNAEGIRSAPDTVKTFYVADRVARLTSCCDSK
jgi:hypothetical protein